MENKIWTRLRTHGQIELDWVLLRLAMWGW